MSTSSGKPTIAGPVVAHFLGMFDWYDDDRMTNPNSGIIACCDFSKMDMLIVSWCDTLNGHANYIKNPDTTKKIYQQIVKTAHTKNEKIVVLLASNFGNSGVVATAGATKKTAKTFAEDLKKIITENNFDGFCLDYESDPADEARMTNFVENITTAMPDKLLAISPAPTNGLTEENVALFDYVLPQTYDHNGFTTWKLGGSLENSIGKNRVLLGRNIEGTPDVIGGRISKPNDPLNGIDPLNDGYGGVFDWRVDQDTRAGSENTPTFKLLPKFWNWMHPGN